MKIKRTPLLAEKKLGRTTGRVDLQVYQREELFLHPTHQREQIVPGKENNQ